MGILLAVGSFFCAMVYVQTNPKKDDTLWQMLLNCTAVLSPLVGFQFIVKNKVFMHASLKRGMSGIIWAMRHGHYG